MASSSGAKQTGSQSGWVPAKFIDRVGAALVAPRRALIAADQTPDPGKTGTDAAMLILLGIVANHTRELVAAGWLAKTDGVGVALAVLASALSAALLSSLVFLFVSGTALTILAGKHRSIGRDYDLACVAFVPFITVEIGAALVFRVAQIRPGGTASGVATVIAYAWALGVIVLGLQLAWSRGARGAKP